MAATLVLGTSDLESCGFESHLEHHTYALKRGPCPHYIFNMSAHRARIPTKLPLADTLGFCRNKSDMWLAVGRAVNK